jgi:hypothetical protein
MGKSYPDIPLANFLAQSDLFLCQYHLLRQQDVAKWMPTGKRLLCVKKFASGKLTLVRKHFAKNLRQV